MKTKPIILPVFVAAMLGSIYFLPSAGEVAQSAVRMDLPGLQDEWYFNPILPSKDEKESLAKDTEFSKAVCITVRPEELDETGRIVPEFFDKGLKRDRIDLSVVLSGADINNSIHRPERCMPAQGHQIHSTSDRRIELHNGRALDVKRLLSVQRLPLNEERTKFIELKCVTYYFFVGHDRITNDHLGRTLLDMRDRLLRGMDQRWAYVSTSMLYGEEVGITESDADTRLTDFVSAFSQRQINWEQVKP